jgi:uncharacterized protein YgiM (DUF1202 family)
MNTRSLIKGVSIAATALTIAFGGVGFVSPTTGLVQMASAQETATFTSGQAVVITADALNVRVDASVDSEIVTTFLNGTWATVVDGPVTGGDYDWYQIEYDDVSGWVAADFLSDAATAGTLATGDTVIVNTAALNLRSAAGSTSDVIEILEISTEGQVIGGPESAEDMDWYQVDFDGVEGWVSRNYLALPPTGDEATATPAATPLADAI